MAVYLGCDVPPDLHYDVDGDLWVRFEDDVARVGLTDVAQTRMGQLVSIRFKRAGRSVKEGGSVATVESAKWVGPVHVPFACEVVETNEPTFADDVLIANRDPYGAGWISVVRPFEPVEDSVGLLTGDAAIESYRQRIELLGVHCFRCAE